MKQTKQAKKVANITALLKKYPTISATAVAETYKVSKNYAYSLLKKAKHDLHNQEAQRLQGVQEVHEMQALAAQGYFDESGRWLQKSQSLAPAPAAVSVPPSREEVINDAVNSPAHYKVGGIETIDFIQAKLTPEEFKGYLLGNVLKYASRAGHKDDIAIDIGKLVWYANRLQSLK